MSRLRNALAVTLFLTVLSAPTMAEGVMDTPKPAGGGAAPVTAPQGGDVSPATTEDPAAEGITDYLVEQALSVYETVLALF